MRYIEAGLIKNGVKIGGNVEVIDISTNHGKAKKYMQKCELMGIKVLEVDYLDEDMVELISVVNKENTGEITIPSFITDIRRKFDGDSCIEYGPLIECKYSKVIVEADNLDNLNSLCSWMQTERIELVIKNGVRN